MQLTATQRSDLASLLARSISRGNLASLCVAVLGRDALAEAGNELADVGAFATRVVDLLHARGRVAEAIGWLQQGLHPNARLTVMITEILAGRRLDGDAAMQALLNRFEPFLNVDRTEQVLARVRRTICAIALGSPIDDIRGSGFLVGPALVMTNFHVIKDFLRRNPDGSYAMDGERYLPNSSGDQIFCFFDYLGRPAPAVPPNDSGGSRAIYVTAAADWLVYARTDLDQDGLPGCPTQINTEYDYAVIRLAKAIGERPAQAGDVSPRGWLRLRDNLQVMHNEGQRVLVFQHPQREPQQFDVGAYDRLDPSQTRVWYEVNTAHGSSGGAAVDSQGELFALHNAEVRLAGAGPGARKLNQGVRIDLITKDVLRAVPELATVPAPPSAGADLWSLTDDLANPEPIIGRKRFRTLVRAMIAADGPRALVVTGPPGSGVRYSIKLLRRVLGAQAPVIVFTPTDISRLKPEQFLDALVEELGILGVSQYPKPQLRGTENVSRWLRLDLPAWLLARITDDATTSAAKYPAWIVINAVADGERLLWANHLKDFVAALCGVRDAGQASIDVPQLRWLFLGSTAEPLPVRGESERDEDLGRYDSFAVDFAEAMQAAWFAIDQKPAGDPKFLKTLATSIRSGATGVPLRKALANFVREIVVNARAGGDH